MTTVSITDVAEHAGVALGTVSNVLNRPHLVAGPTRRRVEAAIRELGFVRNESARHLRAGRSRTVGLVVLDMSNPFFTDVARGVEKTVSDADVSLILCNSDADPAKEKRHLRMLAEQRVLGVLIVPVRGGDQPLREVTDRGIPVVTVDASTRNKERCSVAVDDVKGGGLAAAHLLALGHRKIVFMGGPDPGLRQVLSRLRGVRDALAADASASKLLTLSAPAMTVNGGRVAGSRILGMPRSRRPTAVFCANDLLALGLLQAATAAGANVPDDLAIIGYDDIEFAAGAAIPLSSVRQPRDALGSQAAGLLLDEALGHAHRHTHRVLEPELIVRRSTDPAASSKG